ncbi:MAG TPA: Xaa-Pro peptidase family protein [Chloroflexota bacterium]|nr:Xaa-Pro peptidase family protein [Chloroflexota bacterium]
MSEEHTYPRFSDAEFARRYRLVRERMGEADLDVLLLYGSGGAGSQVQYLSNWPVTREAYLLFPREGEPVLFVHYYNHLPLARRAAVVPDTRWTGVDAAATVATELRRRGLHQRRIGLVGPLPFQPYERLRGLLPDAQLVSFNAAFNTILLVKSEEELEWLRRGAELGDLAMEALEREVRPGLTEHDLAAIVQGAYLRHGGRNVIHFMSTTPMRAPDVCVPAQYQSHRVIQRGDVLITEISVQYWGYGGQCLRPYAIGEEPTPEYRRLYEVAEAAFYAVARALRTGATPAEVIAAADLIEEAGYTIYDDLVHGIGNGYLPPILRTRGTTVEEPPADFRYPENSTWVIQPNVITRDERMGIQVGDMVRVTAHGAERMQRYPLRFVVCGL